MTLHRCLILPFALLGAVLGTLPGQQEEPPKADQQQPVRKVQKLDEWPALEKKLRDRLLACLKQFRKDDEKLHAGAQNRIVAIGDPGVPILMQRVVDRPDNINEHLFAVFDAVLDERHAALMAREIKKPKIELRRYLVKRLSRFHDRDMLPVLRATMKDKDPETAFHGALGALGLGERTAVEPVIEYSKSRWAEVGDAMAAVLPAARSRQAGNWVFEAIVDKPAGVKMSGLRLARYLATKDHHVILRTYLQAHEHAVKKEAVNALRVMHGQEPLEKLTVFQVIGMAKDWLKKV